MNLRLLRSAVVQALTASASVTALVGPRVFAARSQDLAEDELPAMNVVADESNATQLTIDDSGWRDREVTITVQCYAQALTTHDDAVDDLLEACTQALWMNPSLTPLLNGGMRSVEIDKTRDDQAAQPVAVGVMRLRAHVFEQ